MCVDTCAWTLDLRWVCCPLIPTCATTRTRIAAPTTSRPCTPDEHGKTLGKEWENGKTIEKP